MKQEGRNFSDEVSAKMWEINGLGLSTAIYPPALRQPRHVHKFASFSFILSGNYLESYVRKSFLREPSMVVFHPPDEAHAVDFQANVRILNVQFDFGRLASIREHSAVL